MSVFKSLVKGRPPKTNLKRSAKEIQGIPELSSALDVSGEHEEKGKEAERWPRELSKGW